MFDLKVGFTCNNNCIHCVVGSKRGTRDFTTDEIREIIQKDVHEGEEVVLTGGEPTIRHDFINLVHYLNDRGHRVHIQTNGTGFADPRLAEEFSRCDGEVLLAIHSYREDIHNQIVRTRSDQRNMFQLTMQGFENLHTYGVKTETQTVLSSLSIPTLYDTYSFIQKRWPGIYMHMTYPHCMGEAEVNHDIVSVRYSEFRDVIQRCARDYGRWLLVEAIPLCYLYPYQKDIEYIFDLNILSESEERRGVDGSMRGKESHLLDSNGVMKDYNVADRESKRKAPLCRNCVFDSVCPGVWKEYIEYFRTRLDLYPVTKEMVENGTSL